jgi:hypothetical protein
MRETKLMRETKEKRNERQKKRDEKLPAHHLRPGAGEGGLQRAKKEKRREEKKKKREEKKRREEEERTLRIHKRDYLVTIKLLIFKILQ